MKSNRIIPTALAAALAVLSSLASLAARQPNVVVFYLDDMAWAEPGIYGGKTAPTPHMDSIARNGIRFTNGYSSACVCSPARVGLLTGRNQARTGHDAQPTKPGRELYFRFGVQHAVRKGDWKLVKATKEMSPMLVNLSTDPGETTDLSASEPEKMAEMTALFDKWTATMCPPRWEDLRWNGEPKGPKGPNSKNTKKLDLE